MASKPLIPLAFGVSAVVVSGLGQVFDSARRLRVGPAACGGPAQDCGAGNDATVRTACRCRSRSIW